jgi:hypothetical protein
MTLFILAELAQAPSARHFSVCFRLSLSCYSLTLGEFTTVSTTQLTQQSLGDCWVGLARLCRPNRFCCVIAASQDSHFTKAQATAVASPSPTAVAAATQVFQSPTPTTPPSPPTVVLATATSMPPTLTPDPPIPTPAPHLETGSPPLNAIQVIRLERSWLRSVPASTSQKGTVQEVRASYPRLHRG